MKTTCHFYLIVLITLVTSTAHYAQQAESRVIVTLQEDEYPVYSESCIPMSLSDGKLYLVTYLNGFTYVYEEGTKKGPFKDTNTAGITDCGEQRSKTCAVANNYSDDPSKYVSYNNEGKIIIKAGGKEYGPLGQVMQMAFSADYSKVAAIYMDENWNPFFLTPNGKSIQLEGEFSRLIMSASGKTAMVLMKGTRGMNKQDMEQISQMTPEQMMEWAKEMELNNNNPAFYIYLNNGQKLGPYYFGGAFGNNPAFSITGGETWFMEQENKLFINGIQVKDFSDKSISLCDIWISPDGKRFAAYAGYEELIFSDGQTYPYPLEISTLNETGKTYLTWLSLDDKNQLILFKKAL